MTRRWTARLAALAMIGALVGGGAAVAPGEPALVIERVGAARFDPGPDAPVFVLLIGSDERAGLDGARGDALHVVGLNPALHQGTIIDIPRDTYVAIPGAGRDKINAAYRFGGAPAEAAVVGTLVGVPISYVVTTEFAGFTAMVDEAGGVDVDVPFAMNDHFSGAVFPAGRVHMSGAQALAFARNRHIPDGDLRRTVDQGHLLLSALTRLRGENPGPASTLRYLGILARHTRLHGLGLREVYRLARLALTVDPVNLRNVVVPSTLGSAGGASVVFTAPAAASLFADFRDDAVLQSH